LLTFKKFEPLEYYEIIIHIDFITFNNSFDSFIPCLKNLLTEFFLLSEKGKFPSRKIFLHFSMMDEIDDDLLTKK